MAKEKKPFIPKDKPKSWVIFICCCLFGLLVAGPMAFLGKYFKIEPIAYIGIFLFFVCAIIGFLMGLISTANNLSGKYKNIEERDWKNQIW